MSIKIDDEFQSLIPPLTDDEFQRLEKSILAEGVREPIITWNGTIIDGHNRYKICTKHGLSFKTVERDFSSRDEAILFIIANQLARRNLPVAAIGLLKLKEKEVVAREANERMTEGRNQYSPRPNLVQGNDSGKTLEILAKDIPLGRESLRKLDVIDQQAKEGNPIAIKEREQLMSGERKSIHGAFIAVNGNPKPRSSSEIRTHDGRYICSMCGEPINPEDAHAVRKTVHRKCQQNYQRDWEKEKREKAKFTDDSRRICSICGEPIDEGGHYTDKLNWHYKCGLERENENQRKYRDADRDLRENVPVFNNESLIAELKASADMLRDSWLSSININESMGVKLAESDKDMLKQAIENLFDTINEIRKGE